MWQVYSWPACSKEANFHLGPLKLFLFLLIRKLYHQDPPAILTDVNYSVFDVSKHAEGGGVIQKLNIKLNIFSLLS